MLDTKHALHQVVPVGGNVVSPLCSLIGMTALTATHATAAFVDPGIRQSKGNLCYACACKDMFCHVNHEDLPTRTLLQLGLALKLSLLELLLLLPMHQHWLAHKTLLCCLQVTGTQSSCSPCGFIYDGCSERIH